MKKTEQKKEVTCKGQISSVKYRNSDNWAVFTIDQGLFDDPINCNGILPEMCDKGSSVTCAGEFVNNKYGKQLKCSQVVPAPPDVNTAAGVIVLLQRLPGVGPVKAKKTITEYGYEFAWKIALECPSMLGITSLETALEAQKTAQGLIESFETLTYLLSLGLTDYQANKIFGIYGGKALTVVSENPYQLMERIDGFGFRTVDKIALKAGMGIGSDARVQACVLHCLSSSEHNDGHIWFWGRDLTAIIETELRESLVVGANRTNGEKIPGYEEIRRCIYNLHSEGKVLVRQGRVYSKELLDAEKVILGRLQ